MAGFEYRPTNLNLGIKVKLSDKGKDIFYHRHDYLIEKGCKVKPYFPKVDDDGYTYFQMWQFFELYGKYMTFGASCAEGTLETLDVLIEVEKGNKDE